ncbi:MAG: arylsulfotransferase family protein [Pseudomonadota bacterium]
MGALVLAILYGAVAMKTGLFPKEEVNWFFRNLAEVRDELSGVRRAALAIPGKGPTIAHLDEDRMSPGLTFITRLEDDSLHRLEIISPDGTVVHSWVADWFELIEDDGFLPDNLKPKQQPGASIHGVQVLDTGEIVLNFEYLTTLKLDVCGRMVWAAENLGHHSIDVTEDGNLWVGSTEFHPRGSDPPFPNHRAPFYEWTAQRLKPDGMPGEEISLVELLLKNDLLGLLYATNQQNTDPQSSGDTLHLNDVEEFPPDLAPGVFTHGDLMVSLRNINTVLVFDPATGVIKHRATGLFLRQHDPDFIDGNRYIVFDNRNLGTAETPLARSRILEVTAAETGGVESIREFHRGPNSPDFYTNVKGRQQILANGNILIVVSREGRVLELTSDGDPVWEYRNQVAEDRRGEVTEAQRLPPHLDEGFFAAARAFCPS